MSRYPQKQKFLKSQLAKRFARSEAAKGGKSPAAGLLSAPLCKEEHRALGSDIHRQVLCSQRTSELANRAKQDGLTTSSAVDKRRSGVPHSHHSTPPC